jgi:hypothetical protein
MGPLRISVFRAAALPLLLLFCVPVQAASSRCESALLPVFWTTAEPHTLGKQDLTYSFDSELRDFDVFAFLMQTESGRALLNRKYGARKYSAQQLADLAGVSEKQLKVFGLRKEVDRSQTRFALTDLNPKLMDAAVSSKRKGLALRWNQLVGWLSPPAEVGEVERELQSRGLPVETHLDYSGLQVEVTHGSYEVSPSRYYALVKDGMHGLFKTPQTHLHLGMPGSLRPEEAHAIARAVETKIILNWAASQDSEGARLAYYEGSSLRADIKQAELRGAIRMQLNEWTVPAPSHNLEIRQWDSIEDGLDLLGLAGELVLEHERLRIIPAFDAAKISDPFTDNLNGALKYAGELLSRSAEPEKASIGNGLLALASEVENAGTITPQFRKKTYKFLNEHSVMELLGKSAFVE